MNNTKKVAVIGGGSWATALVKILSGNLDQVGWYMRNNNAIEHILEYGTNPNYLSLAKLNVSKLDISSDINEIIENYKLIVFAVPSAFLKKELEKLNTSLKEKIIFSAIKGIIPEDRIIVGDFFQLKYSIDIKNIGVITGPCHAEEVALERLSYLTIASENQANAKVMAKYLSCDYIKTIISHDIFGTEYASVLKNIFSIAVGIANGLGYGDNFQAVLMSNAIREMDSFIKRVHPINRNINDSAYLGDLLVTGYSPFSRNRTFGNMIGKGDSVESAQKKMNMIVEGYYAVKSISVLNEKLKINMPITTAVYNILYKNESPKKQIEILTNKLN
ncbi:NAD(P)H-dependent glycerol-3-phosphate dehydrogenase [Ichthyobacterium seriolicida]|uniref:Glycerol-3-phosphate dehydrogenase n=1 Tax=Ichthyobacterium seriolicida TaxID=242600 RepID=A0A1J1E5F6_9FLAO|nr:NAD(P)H-dependent glycerol-3-phosphate dehydrogenase [Ichthyobacterium seriolicida]BAV94542.1 glycerol-3-phosphate dehydrogenase [Ichthyobacterium seriolicida]